MRKVLTPVCLLAVGLLVPSVCLAGDAVPLKIISKSLQNDTSSGPPLGTALEGSTGYALSLRNDSDKVITAWKLSCVQAESDGNRAEARNCVHGIFSSRESRLGPLLRDSS